MDTTKDLISKAKYQLYKGFPFFSYLIEHLDIIEDNVNVPTMGVDGRGNVYYNKEWVNSICPNNYTKTLMGTLAHEALHLVFEHPRRMKGRTAMIGNTSLWNIAGDIYINNIIISNYQSHTIKDMQMELPEKVLRPVDNKIEWMGIKIVDINLKTTEEIYDELKAGVQEQLKNNKGKGKGKGQSIPCTGFDSHIDWDKADEDKNGKANSVSKSGKAWDKVMAEAKAHAQARGDSPLGMDREINDIHKSRINWKHFIRRIVSKSIPFDYTWAKPNKKYIGEDLYLPSTYGESIRVIFGIDTSGSQSQEDLTDSMSEVVAITKQYSNIEFRAITFDTECHENLHVYNGNINKLKQLKMRGGGGSSSLCLYNLIEEKKYNRNTKLLIFFTDGYMEFPKKFTIPTILVLTENHCAIKDLPKQALAVIEMKPR